jgi:hypothetical protein
MQIARVISRRLSPSFSPSCCGTRVPTLIFRFPGTLYALRTSKFFPANSSFNIHVNVEGSYTCLSCNFRQTKLQGSFSPSSVQSISIQIFSFFFDSSDIDSANKHEISLVHLGFLPTRPSVPLRSWKLETPRFLQF